MADQAPTEDAPVTFHVKSSNDKKYTITVPLSLTVLQLKEKLSDPSYADLPPPRQRLIYSGRVLKDPDTLSTYKIKEGNTVHLVKGADSNTRQNPANQGSSVPVPNASNPAVPTNLSSGPGANNPLAGLTGARYAGLAHLPNQSLFGPDGGMGPPPDPEQIIHMLENPQFASTINEALSNPQIIETMINQNPMLRDMGPEMRQMLQTPEFRRMMTDPAMLRQTMQMQRAMGGGPFGRTGQNQSFPAPGATDTTPIGANASETGSGNQQQGQQQQPNPFSMFGGAGGAQGNPFASLFNPAAFGAPPNQSESGTNNPTSGEDGNPSGQPQGQQQQQQQFNPFANNPFLQNPQLMSQFMQAMNPQTQGTNQSAPNADSTTQSSTTDTTRNAQSPPPNPFAALLSSAMANPYGNQQNPAGGNANSTAAALEAMLGAGAGAGGANPFMPPGWANAFGGAGGAFGQGQADGADRQQPQDTRPPEERYEQQLRQLNEMGFYDFDSNVEALRRSGGSVQGAIEYLLSRPPA